MSLTESLIERILRESTTIAVVGASRDPDKAAHGIPKALKAAGFRVFPVNPYAEEIFGERVHRRLSDVPGPVDLVLVFRPSEEAPGIAREAAAIGAKALWLQQGLVSPEARELAESKGLRYVEDRCIGVERARYQVTKSR